MQTGSAAETNRDELHPQPCIGRSVGCKPYSPPRHQNAFSIRSGLLVARPRCAPTSPNSAQAPRRPSPCRSIQAGPRLKGAFAQQFQSRSCDENLPESTRAPRRVASHPGARAALLLLRARSFRLKEWRSPKGQHAQLAWRTAHREFLILGGQKYLQPGDPAIRPDRTGLDSAGPACVYSLRKRK